LTEWDNPAEVMLGHLTVNKIVVMKPTGRIETSKYPQEKKTTVIP